MLYKPLPLREPVHTMGPKSMDAIKDTCVAICAEILTLTGSLSKIIAQDQPITSTMEGVRVRLSPRQSLVVECTTLQAALVARLYRHVMKKYRIGVKLRCAGAIYQIRVMNRHTKEMTIQHHAHVDSEQAAHKAAVIALLHHVLDCDGV